MRGGYVATEVLEMAYAKERKIAGKAATSCSKVTFVRARHPTPNISRTGLFIWRDLGCGGA